MGTENVLMSVFRGIIGVLSLVLIAWLFSNNKKKVNWSLVLVGLGLQLVFAYAILNNDLIKQGFNSLAGFFVVILDFTKAGSSFLFGDIVNRVDNFGYIFAFQVLPTVVFFSALSSVLYYLGVLQWIVYGIAWVMQKTMKLSGSESLAAAANIFIGQTEAPLLIKPYIGRMTASEVFSLMVGGMATIAGGVLAAYVGFLGGTDPAQQQIFATHLLSASVMSAPAALLMAKIIFPQTEEINTDMAINKASIGNNLLEAISNGTSEGLKLAVNVGAMLLVFTALMAMLNYGLKDLIGNWTGLNEIILNQSGGRYDGLSAQYLLAYVFAPISFLIGIPDADILAVGQLLGEKTILNEFYAYGTLADLKSSGILSNEKSIIMATYALCGFANFASIGIQIGGIGVLAPEKRTLLSKLGLKALVGGTLACLLTAAIIGMFF